MGWEEDWRGLREVEAERVLRDIRRRRDLDESREVTRVERYTYPMSSHHLIS